MTYNYLYLTGIILSFLVGFSGLWIGLRNSRKTIFINSITASRIKYIQDLRNAVAEFCGLIYTYNTEYLEFEKGESATNQKQPPDEKNIQLKKELNDLKKRIDNLKYLIRLHLNVEDEYYDKIIIKLVDEVIENSPNNPTKNIDELITIMQFLLKLEWEGAKLESQKGIVSKRRKKKLYKKYAIKHKEYIENIKIDNNGK